METAEVDTPAEAAELVPHYVWNMPSRLTGKETWQTRDKLTAEQALACNPDAWPVYRTVVLLPVRRVSAGTASGAAAW